MSVHLGTEVSAADLARLESRWRGSKGLEERLLDAYLALTRCWSCKAPLVTDEHPNCQDCPDYPGTDARSHGGTDG